MTGTVNVQLTAVPWDQALDLILRTNKLGYIVDGTVVRIASLAALADEESQRRKLTEEQALSGELRFLTKTLSYAKAEELAPLLTKSALSARGTVQVDPRTNTIIITDLAARLTTASDLIAILDKPQPQVEIEARIVQVAEQDLRNARCGIQWGFSGLVASTPGTYTDLRVLQQRRPDHGAGSRHHGWHDLADSAPQPTVVNLPATAATSAIGLALGSVNGGIQPGRPAVGGRKQRQTEIAVNAACLHAEQLVEAEITQAREASVSDRGEPTR